MKTIQRKLDNIKGFDLTREEKTILKGGAEVPCPVKCQLSDESGPIGNPDCCPHASVDQCELEIGEYYSSNGWFAICWFV